MIKAKTSTELADHIERYLLKRAQVKPGQALGDATEDQIKIIMEA